MHRKDAEEFASLRTQNLNYTLYLVHLCQRIVGESNQGTHGNADVNPGVLECQSHREPDDRAQSSFIFAALNILPNPDLS